MQNNFCTKIKALESFVAQYTGWRRYGIAAVNGAIASYAMPPYGFIALFVFAIVILLWQTNGCAKVKQALALGYAFGFGFFAWGLLWINNALLVYGGELGVLVIPFTIFIGLWGGLFVAPATALAFSVPKGSARILVFSAVFATMEWVRSWLFTGLAWNLTASIWNESLPIMQALAVIGPYGLGLLTITLFASFSLLASLHKKDLFLWAGMCLVFGLLFLWGNQRIDHAEPSFVKDTKLRIVQPNIPQKLKWKHEEIYKNFATYLDLSSRNLTEDITHIIWGETAVTFPLHKDKNSMMKIARTFAEDKTLITGMIRVRGNSRKDFNVFNSVAVITGSGNIVGGYDKSHLVPFGEYVPFKAMLPINEITTGLPDFTAGSGVETIAIPHAPKAGILICYEIIFPAQVVKDDNRPEWLINITNDGWYGESSGPYQHLVTAKMRAIEEGLPIVRAANTGISAVINPYGEIISYLPLNHDGVLDSLLPQALPVTIYAKYENSLFGIILILWLAGAFLLSFPSKKLYQEPF